jgi:hypothetical protein
MNGIAFLIYTTEEGGLFKTIRENEDNLYEEVVKRGYLLKRNWAFDQMDELKLSLIAKVIVSEHHDFVLDGPRG